MVFITRSPETGKEEFPTLTDAIEHAENDDTVEVISFELPTGETVELDRTLGGDWALDVPMVRA